MTKHTKTIRLHFACPKRTEKDRPAKWIIDEKALLRLRGGRRMKLELFVGTACPYCHMVQKEIEKEGRTDIEICNIDLSQDHMKRLIEVGGKEQIPCLFIDGKPLYESRDIVKWLRSNPQA